jgi:hypothetical protein
MIHRGQFNGHDGTVNAVGLLSIHVAAADPNQANAKLRAKSSPKTRLFWDLWHLDRIEHLDHCQGEATWRPKGADPGCRTDRFNPKNPRDIRGF